MHLRSPKDFYIGTTGPKQAKDKGEEVDFLGDREINDDNVKRVYPSTQEKTENKPYQNTGFLCFLNQRLVCALNLGDYTEILVVGDCLNIQPGNC